jgi:hypothetical protein
LTKKQPHKYIYIKISKYYFITHQLNYCIYNKHIILIFPWTNFNNILKQIPDNVYTIFQKHDNKIKRVNKYYVFNGIAFETLDDGTINAITIFEN